MAKMTEDEATKLATDLINKAEQKIDSGITGYPYLTYKGIDKDLIKSISECILNVTNNKVKEKPRLKRNVIIENEKGFQGSWIAIPREDFDSLKEFLNDL